VAFHKEVSDQVSISPIYYEQLFRTKGLCTAFMRLQFGFVIFCRKNFGAKAAHEMLVKLTAGKEKSFINCRRGRVRHFKWNPNDDFSEQVFDEVRTIGMYLCKSYKNL
jgi:hypothetical protein